jgi:hypothetical protein
VLGPAVTVWSAALAGTTISATRASGSGQRDSTPPY